MQSMLRREIEALEREIEALERHVEALQANLKRPGRDPSGRDELQRFLDKQSELIDKQRELDQKRRTQALVREGKYYAATKRVWKAVSCDLARDSSGAFLAETWRKLVRKTVDFECLAMSKVRKKLKLYQSTKEHAEDNNYESITIKSLRSTATNATKQKVWPKDLAGNALDEYAEGAHLLPTGKSDHVDWFRVGGAAVGLDENNSDVMNMLKAIRGCKNPQRSDKRRFDHEGVLHFVSNRLYLAQQKYLIDGASPKMLVVPVLPLEKIRDWDGAGYDAIVLVGEPYSDTPVDNPMADEQVHSAFSAARLTNDDIRTALPSLVKDAASTLKAGVVALAEMLLSLNDNELHDIDTVDKESAKRLRKARGNLVTQKSVLVPDFINDSVKEGDCRVKLVSFRAHSDDELPSHVAPDPLLLLFKAANVFGRLTGMEFLSNGIIPTFDSESDIEQIEMYAALMDAVPQRKSHSPIGMLVGPR